MQQLRKLLFALPAVLFITAPQVHGMYYVKAMYNSIRGKNQELFRAAQRGNILRVQELIRDGININTHQFEREYTPLHIAARQGHLDVTQLLIENGANVNSHNKYQHTPLHIAAREGNLKVVQLLIENGSTVNSHNRYKETPLYMAVKRGHLKVAQLLIDNGADIITQDNMFEAAPLHEAAKRQHVKIVQLLINNGANLNMQDISRITPLHRAAIAGNKEIIQLLIYNGADVNVQDHFKNTPLHNAARSGNTEIAQLLINNGANVNTQDYFKNRPYQIARSQGNTDIIGLCNRIRRLHKNYIDRVITHDTSHETRMYYAQAMIACGYCDVARRIISEHLNPLSDDEYANIILHTQLHRHNIDHSTYNQFMKDMRKHLEDNNKAQAVVNKAWNNVRNGYASPQAIMGVLKTYEDQCRDFCDNDGNTIAHLSTSAQLNDLLPHIMTLVMQNKNHKPRNNNNKTPVMLRREIGNNNGVQIIKDTIEAQQTLRGTAPGMNGNMHYIPREIATNITKHM